MIIGVNLQPHGVTHPSHGGGAQGVQRSPTGVNVTLALSLGHRQAPTPLRVTRSGQGDSRGSRPPACRMKSYRPANSALTYCYKRYSHMRHVIIGERCAICALSYPPKTHREFRKQAL